MTQVKGNTYVTKQAHRMKAAMYTALYQSIKYMKEESHLGV